MSNFPIIRYRGFDTWIPETDIDDIDAKGNVLTDVSNISFRNGYIENVHSPESVTLPANVQADIDAGYELLTTKGFTHSTQGYVAFYALYKLISGQHTLKFYVDNTLLNIDEMSSSITFDAKPTNISYNVVNDQLKINLNVNVTYSAIDSGKTVIANLTLAYLPDTIDYITTKVGEAKVQLSIPPAPLDDLSASGTYTGNQTKTYNIQIDSTGTPDTFKWNVNGGSYTTGVAITGLPQALTDGVYIVFDNTTGHGLSTQWDIVATNGLTRQAGWYLYPRWLGWSMENDANLLNRPNPADIEDFEDSTYYYNITFPASTSISSPFTIDSSVKYLGSKSALGSTSDGYLYIVSGGSIYDPYFNMAFQNIVNPRILNFYALTSVNKSVIIEIHNITTGADSNISIATEIIQTNGNWAYIEIELDLPDGTYDLELRQMPVKAVGWTGDEYDWADTWEFNKLNIDNFSFTTGNNEKAVLIAKYFDGQRARLVDGSYMGNQVTIKMAAIDYRISEYEIYRPGSNSPTIYFLWGTVSPDGEWEFNGTNITKTLSLKETTNSLNFNYNLTEKDSVNNQRYIYSEISHKGRVYFVNNDYKVYQSHILPNLTIQADSFPYNEEESFGYFIVDQSRINKALAVTPTNNMIIFTDNGIYVYYIQAATRGVFRSLRMSSGSIAITNSKSISRSVTGDPATDGLFWVDYNGVYFYNGDNRPPVNLILNTHEIFWNNISKTDKDSAIGFYNPVLREYWLQIGNRIYAYELPYRKWRKYLFSNQGINEFQGISNNIIYWRTGNGITKYDVTNLSYEPLSIITPWSETNLTEIHHKILQGIYLIFGDGDATTLWVRIFVDDYLLSDYSLDTSVRVHKLLTPLGIRYKRIRFYIFATIPPFNNEHIIIKEFGYLYTDDANEALVMEPIDIANISVYNSTATNWESITNKVWGI